MKLIWRDKGFQTHGLVRCCTGEMNCSRAFDSMQWKHGEEGMDEWLMQVA